MAGSTPTPGASRSPTTTRTGTARTKKQQSELAAFDAVLMRKDPPFDLEYLTSVWLLSQASARARAYSTTRPRCATTTRSSASSNSRSSSRRRWRRAIGRGARFIDEHRDVILKRLDGMGGESIFRVREDDPNAT